MKIKSLGILVICLNFIFCTSAQKKIQNAQNKDPRYQYNLGLYHLQNGNADEAIKYLKKSISLKPNYYLAYNSLGIAYLTKGKIKEAEPYFLDCLKINPSFTEAINNLGTVYQELGILDKAEEYFRKASADKTYKSRHLPFYNLAKLYYLQGKYREAFFYVESSIDNNKSMIMAYNLKGIICEALNDLDKAIRSYRIALDKLQQDETIPEYIDISYNLAVAYFKNKEYDRSRDIFLKIYPSVYDLEKRKSIDKYLKEMK
jgi:Tfp pilus assembly protein PilF